MMLIIEQMNKNTTHNSQRINFYPLFKTRTQTEIESQVPLLHKRLSFLVIYEHTLNLKF